MCVCVCARLCVYVCVCVETHLRPHFSLSTVANMSRGSFSGGATDAALLCCRPLPPKVGFVGGGEREREGKRGVLWWVRPQPFFSLSSLFFFPPLPLRLLHLRTAAVVLRVCEKENGGSGRSQQRERPASHSGDGRSRGLSEDSFFAFSLCIFL